MEIRDDRNPKEEGTDFGRLKSGQSFIKPDEYDDDEVFIKMGFNNTNAELPDEDEGWYAVLVRTGEFLYFYNDNKVIPINAMVVIND